MTDNCTWDKMGHCDEMRVKHEIPDGDTSKCWKQHYLNLPVFELQFHQDVNRDACKIQAVEEES